MFQILCFFDFSTSLLFILYGCDNKGKVDITITYFFVSDPPPLLVHNCAG